MKFANHFRAFLREVVNINQTRLDTLDQHVDAIIAHLKTHDDLSAHFEGNLPQGSWAHLTIIKPLEGRTYDADFLLQMSRVSGWQPKDYLLQVRAALKDSAIYEDMTSLKTRCVRVEYAGDCHVDIVPFVANPGGGLIVNRLDNAFEETNPEGYTSWFDGQHENASSELRRVVRLVKYLRDVKQTFSVKSVILTTLLASRVPSSAVDGQYSDTPTALRTLTMSLADYLAGFPEQPPSVPDPSRLGADFNHRWPSQDVYKNFRSKIRFYADKIDAAYRDGDAASSMTKWREVFGPDFGYDPSATKKLALTEDCAPGEQFITDSQFAVRMADPLPYTVRVSCRVLPKAGFRTGDLRELVRVGADQELEFRVSSCTVPQPYRVFWKIKNSGAAAVQATCLRGDIHEEHVRREPTKFRGSHWVECYIVKDGVCLARQRYDVRIR